jgi:hypothetical protein
MNRYIIASQYNVKSFQNFHLGRILATIKEYLQFSRTDVSSSKFYFQTMAITKVDDFST